MIVKNIFQMKRREFISWKDLIMKMIEEKELLLKMKVRPTLK